jgi:hypothetical protein
MRARFQTVQSAAMLMAAMPESRKHIASATNSAWTASETINLESRVMIPANVRPERRGAESVKMQTGRAVPRPLQAAGWAESLMASCR